MWRLSVPWQNQGCRRKRRVIQEDVGVGLLGAVWPVLGVLPQKPGAAKLTNETLDLATGHAQFGSEGLDRRKAQAIFASEPGKSAIEELGRG
jgi:hypothetical protein